LKINYFYSLTPRQFDNILTGYRNKEEAKEKASWERSRMQMYYSVVAQQGSDKIKIEDILKFPWERKTTSISDKAPKTKKQLQDFWDRKDKKATE
jgi:hypothetical protein